MAVEQRKIDYILVGQGLAGTLLAYFLLRENKSIVIFDKGHKEASSHIAAGLMNPVTGRRFVKSWQYDTFFEYAEQTYLEIGKKLNHSFYQPQIIWRALVNPGEENDWQARMGEEGYQNYLLEGYPGDWVKQFQSVYGWGKVQMAAQVNLPQLITKFRQIFQQQKILYPESFDYQGLKIETDRVQYKNYQASRVLFCEGSGVIHNPWFSHLPFVPSKGEVLIVKIPDLYTTNIIKHKSFLIPLGNNHYWVGSNYEWEDLTFRPTVIGRNKLISNLQKTLSIPFEVVDHLAAIRPTVKDRRPLIGAHPDYPGLFLFNGLGTKGASLGPFWADHIVEHLVNGAPLSEEVDLLRTRS